MPWHENAYLIEKPTGRRANIWRRARFLGRQLMPGLSFTGQLCWQFEGGGSYRHAHDEEAVLDMRELDLREAREVGLA